MDYFSNYHKIYAKNENQFLIPQVHLHLQVH